MSGRGGALERKRKNSRGPQCDVRVLDATVHDKCMWLPIPSEPTTQARPPQHMLHGGGHWSRMDAHTGKCGLTKTKGATNGEREKYGRSARQKSCDTLLALISSHAAVAASGSDWTSSSVVPRLAVSSLLMSPSSALGGGVQMSWSCGSRWRRLFNQNGICC